MEKFNRTGVKSGLGYVYSTSLALASIVFVLVTVLLVILWNGLGYFWPSNVKTFHMKDGSKILGTLVRESKGSNDTEPAIQVKIANRDFYGLDHRWMNLGDIEKITEEPNAVEIERMEYGNFYGFLGTTLADEAEQLALYQEKREISDALIEAQEEIGEKIKQRNMRLQKLEYEIRKIGLDDPQNLQAREIQSLAEEKAKLEKETEKFIEEQYRLRQQNTTHKISIRDVNGQSGEIEVSQIVKLFFPNRMGFFEKLFHYIGKFIELISDNPREANTEGGIFPAIFGTVIMIFIMSVFSFPLGVIAAVYLRIYAKEGWVVKTVRIAVNNLAGVPSIVFGVFGLGFFVYVVGGSIDELFFPERLPNPTFGTGGILWSSLTLALLTVPVVIVATEEALSSIPKGMYEASIALGATRLQTLFNILLPVASPGILTGFILAMARAAGEVAPLMITGVVKLTPNLVIDGTFPFFHLERKFMHLGFHIFDVGFQSPNVEAAKPMVYVTTILLVLIVLIMTSAAIYLRERLKKKFTSRAI